MAYKPWFLEEKKVYHVKFAFYFTKEIQKNPQSRVCVLCDLGGEKITPSFSYVVKVVGVVKVVCRRIAKKK